MLHVFIPPQPNVESPEPGSAATSPVPLSGAPSRPRLEESEEAASTDTKESPARKGRRKKWSFKRAKSLDQLVEGEPVLQMCVRVCVCVCVCVCILPISHCVSGHIIQKDNYSS